MLALPRTSDDRAVATANLLLGSSARPSPSSCDVWSGLVVGWFLSALCLSACARELQLGYHDDKYEIGRDAIHPWMGRRPVPGCHAPMPIPMMGKRLDSLAASDPLECSAMHRHRLFV